MSSHTFSRVTVILEILEMDDAVRSGLGSGFKKVVFCLDSPPIKIDNFDSDCAILM